LAIGDCCSSDVRVQLEPLLEYLSALDEPIAPVWGDWALTQIGGGTNNLLYRAGGPFGDYAIKFTVPDERDRAGREYHSLLALQRAGLAVAPEPVLLDRASYRYPVVVQTWLDGEMLTTPPTTDEDWTSLIEHYVAVHSLTPDTSTVSMPAAVFTAHTFDDAIALLRHQQIARLPPSEQPAVLRDLLRRLETQRMPAWTKAPPALCHVDVNFRNILRRPGQWASVDWENGGWGDPAFEIAELMTHPAYLDVPALRWAWVADAYVSRVDDPTARERIDVYYRVLLVWWVARMARYLYETPRGLDQRLVQPAPGWEAEARRKYEWYVEAAQEQVK
jgi:Ser/Thr protein kinase RdoA (MazF antagonist)